MAKGKSRSKTTNRNRTQNVQKKKLRQRRPRRNTGRRNTFTGLIVKGVKTMLASIPGASVLSPLADIIFSSFGLASNYSVSPSDGKVSSTAFIYGMCSCTGIKYSNILAHAPLVARNTGKGPRIVFDTPFHDAKLLSVDFVLTPQNNLDTRNGKWAAVFIPVRNVSDVVGLPRDYTPMSMAQLTKLPGSVTTAADRPLSLSYSPTVEDGYAYQFNTIDSIFGYLIVSFSQDIRNNWIDFNATEFAPDITMTGRLKIREPVLGGTVHSYEDNTWKADTGIHLFFPQKYVDTEKKTGVTLNSKYVCTKDSSGFCTVSGYEYKFKGGYSDSLCDDFELLNH